MKPGARLFRTRFALRKTALDLSDRQVARLIGRDSTTISRWARGVGSPHVGELLALSRVLRCSPAWLLGESHDVPPADDIDLASYERGYRAAYSEIRAALRHQTNAGRMLGNPGKTRKGG